MSNYFSGKFGEKNNFVKQIKVQTYKKDSSTNMTTQAGPLKSRQD